MFCSKCNGRIFIDRVFSQKLHIELYCIMCGKRWMINRETSKLGKWLDQKESAYKKDFSISS